MLAEVFHLTREDSRKVGKPIQTYLVGLAPPEFVVVAYPRPGSCVVGAGPPAVALSIGLAAL